MSRWFPYVLMLLLTLPSLALAQDSAESEETAQADDASKTEGDAADGSEGSAEDVAEGAEDVAEGAEDVAEGAEDDAEDAEDAAESAEDGAEGVEDAAEVVEAAVEDAPEAVAPEEAVEDAAEDAPEAAAPEEAVEDAAEDATEAVIPAEAPADVEAAAEESAQKKAEVSLIAEAGVVWLSGNSSSINANGAVRFGVAFGRHRIGVNFGGNYGRSVVDTNGDGKTRLDLENEEGVSDEWQTTATRVFGDIRYDISILPDVNSAYVGVGMFHDPFAGFAYRLRADAGYSHKIVNTPVHLLVAELGPNYTRELLRNNPDTADDDDSSTRINNFVGGRLFAGYTLTPNETFGFFLNVETLLGGADNVDGTFDGRLILDTGISANITKVFSIKLGFGMNFDFVPPDVDGVEGPDVRPIDTTTMFTIVATLF